MLKLLVVDDEADICDFVKNFFKERDFEVMAAYNGRDAVNIVKEKRPDIVILDMLMPVMDGMQTLKELRRLKLPIRVIVVTAVEDTDKVNEAKKYGAMEYITKPLLLEQLERTVLSIAEQVRTGMYNK